LPGIEVDPSKPGDFMKPKSQVIDQGDLYRSRLDQILNRKHPLFVLAGEIDWSAFTKEFGSLYVEKMGRPALPIRLLVGLHYLKHAFNVSDENVVVQFFENPYWQYFCGFEYFQHRLPLDPTTLVKWRKRIGPRGMEKLLAETLGTAKRQGQLTEQHMARGNVDTTVQEKTIAFPTDARLYFKARRLLVRLAKHRKIKLRQSYERIGKKAFVMQNRYSHARQMQRARRELKRLRTQLGCVIRDLKRKCPQPDQTLATMLARAERIYRQQRSDSNKLYSLDAPEVECIAKGKAHKSTSSAARSRWSAPHKTTGSFGCRPSMATRTTGTPSRPLWRRVNTSPAGARNTPTATGATRARRSIWATRPSIWPASARAA
jgi:IS5 family transposase